MVLLPKPTQVVLVSKSNQNVTVLQHYHVFNVKWVTSQSKSKSRSRWLVIDWYCPPVKYILFCESLAINLICHVGMRTPESSTIMTSWFKSFLGAYCFSQCSSSSSSEEILLPVHNQWKKLCPTPCQIYSTPRTCAPHLLGEHNKCLKLKTLKIPTEPTIHATVLKLHHNIAPVRQKLLSI